MKNTAKRAIGNNGHTVIFKDKEHENFYEEYLEKCRYQDSYHMALVYCLGISEDTRKAVNTIYDFKTGLIVFTKIRNWTERQLTRNSC